MGEYVAPVLLVVVMIAGVTHDIMFRRKVRAYIVRKRKRALEDTLQILGLGTRKSDQKDTEDNQHA